MPSLWKHMNSGENTANKYCANDDPKCIFNESQTKVIVMRPYPNVFMLNISWFSDITSYMETFYFSISIAQ